MPGVLSDAALFALPGTKPPKPRDGEVARSMSLKVLGSRKPGFRLGEWVARSSSSRTAPSGRAAQPASWKPHIKHLGGGRVVGATTERGVGDDSLAVPGPRTKRHGQRRTSSLDSRATQWLDFYQTAAADDGTRPRIQASPKPALSRGTPGHRQTTPGDSQPNADLRPAPLRVPSTEKRPSPRSHRQPVTSLGHDLARKPLPSLPVYPAKVVPAKNSTTGPRGAGEAATPRHPGLGAEEPLSGQNSPEIPVPTICLHTPPLTPDSTTGVAVRTRERTAKGKEEGAGGGSAAAAGHKLTPGAEHLGSPTRRAQRAPGTSESSRPCYTNQERMWLHTNYRGEAPFLKAWGLDITKLDDRFEGLAIVRDLIRAEARPPEGSRGNDGL